MRGPIRPVAVLEAPEEEALVELLPNEQWPSDHLHLLVDLELL